MNSTTTIALSGLSAAARTAEVAAHNIANAQTPGFRRQIAQAQTQPGGGVTVEVAQAAEPGESLETDVVQQMAASYAYRANLRTLQMQHTRLGTLLDVKV